MAAGRRSKFAAPRRPRAVRTFARHRAAERDQPRGTSDWRDLPGGRTTTSTVRRVGDSQLVSTLYHVPAGSSPDFAAMDLLEPADADVAAMIAHFRTLEPRSDAAQDPSFGTPLDDDTTAASL